MFTKGYHNDLVLDDGYDHLVAYDHTIRTKGAGTMTQGVPPAQELNQVVLELRSTGFLIPGFQQISSSASNQKPPAAPRPAVAAEDGTSFNQVALLESLLSKEKRIHKISLLNHLLSDGASQETHGEPNSSPPGQSVTNRTVLEINRNHNTNQIELLEMLLQKESTSDQSSTDKDAQLDRSSDRVDTIIAVESDEEGQAKEEKAQQENMQVSILSANAGPYRQRQALNRKLKEDRIKLAQSRDVADGRWSRCPVTIKPYDKWQRKDHQNEPDHDAKMSDNGIGHKKIHKRKTAAHFHRSRNDFSANKKCC